MPLLVAWNFHIEVVFYCFATYAAPFFNVVCFLFLLTLLNGLVNRVMPRWALRPGELIVVYVMLSVQGALCSHNMMELLLTMLAHPWKFARPENRWAEDPSPLRFKPGHLRGLAPAGRLDIDSIGLLVFTQDGRIARSLIGDDSSIEKEYHVRVEGRLDEAGLKRLNHGLSLDGVALRPAKVSWLNEDQLRFVLREGKKRQIRRMCELVGLKVVGLKRVRIGRVMLGNLPPGQWRYLGPNESF